jgi:uncharacterized membrane protein
MAFLANVLRCSILSLPDLSRLIAIDASVGLRAALKFADASLFGFKLPVFAARNFAGCNAAANTLFLDRLTAIDFVGGGRRCHEHRG